MLFLHTMSSLFLTITPSKKKITPISRRIEVRVNYWVMVHEIICSSQILMRLLSSDQIGTLLCRISISNHILGLYFPIKLRLLHHLSAVSDQPLLPIILAPGNFQESITTGEFSQGNETNEAFNIFRFTFSSITDLVLSFVLHHHTLLSA